jgi:hypothetical protein
MASVHHAKQDAQPYMPGKKPFKAQPVAVMPPTPPLPAVAAPVFATGKEEVEEEEEKPHRKGHTADDKPKRKIWKSHKDCERCNHRRERDLAASAGKSKFEQRVAEEVKARIAELAGGGGGGGDMEVAPAAPRSHTGK